MAFILTCGSRSRSRSAYHAETARCPFCGKAGPLHLPAEQISLELSPETEHGATP
jgi:hypothetical protein